MEFPNGVWVKNWSVNVGMVFDSLDGELYSKVFEDKLGKKLDNSIMSYEKGISANYLLKSELEACCLYLTKKVEIDINVAKKWCEQLKLETDKINAMMDKFNHQTAITYKDFQELKEQFYNHVAPNFAIKRAVDFFSPDLVNKFMDEFEEARVYTESVYMDFEKLINKILFNIAQKNKYPGDLIVCITHNELEKYLQTGELPEKQVVKQRVEDTLLWYQNGECKMYTGEEAKRIREQITNPQKSREIKGMTAYGGTVRGRVRIVFEPSEVKEFEEGDILVTGMTRPEFIPLMKKAAAFITDSGGMLSHAAITAREMKKPCVVGTEVATKVLKDGDMVEVDADNGVVKILKGVGEKKNFSTTLEE